MIDRCLQFILDAKDEQLKAKALTGLVEALQDEQLEANPIAWPASVCDPFNIEERLDTRPGQSPRGQLPRPRCDSTSDGHDR